MIEFNRYNALYVGEEIIPPVDVTKIAWVTRHYPEEFYLKILQIIYKNVALTHFHNVIFNSNCHFTDFIRKLKDAGFIPYPVAPIFMIEQATMMEDLEFGRFVLNYDLEKNKTLRYVEKWTNGQRSVLLTGNKLQLLEQRKQLIAV